MQLINTLTFVAASASLAMASDKHCGNGQPRFTEARLANIIDSLRSPFNQIIEAEPHGPCVQLGCTGGTGAYLCSEGDKIFKSRTISDILDNGFKACNGDTPQSWKDDQNYAPAFEWFEDTYRVFVQGSEPC